MKRPWSFNYCLIANNRSEVHNACHPKDFCSRLCTDSHESRARKSTRPFWPGCLWHNSWDSCPVPGDSQPQLFTKILGSLLAMVEGYVWVQLLTLCTGLDKISPRGPTPLGLNSQTPSQITTKMAIPGLNSRRIKNSLIYKTGRFTLFLHLCWWDEEKPSKAILSQEIWKPYLSLQLHLSSQPAKKIYLFWILKTFRVTSDLFSQEAIWEKEKTFV